MYARWDCWQFGARVYPSQLSFTAQPPHRLPEPKRTRGLLFGPVVAELDYEPAFNVLWRFFGILLNHASKSRPGSGVSRRSRLQQYSKWTEIAWQVVLPQLDLRDS